MLLELVSAIVVGISVGGVVHALRRWLLPMLPRWLVPAISGAAMMTIVIINDYQWFDVHSKRLSKDALVVHKSRYSSVLKPWTIVAPPVGRFVVMGKARAAENADNPDLVLTTLYLYERYRPLVQLHQVIHCGAKARADFEKASYIPKPGESLGTHWVSLSENDPILKQACKAYYATR